VVVGSRDCPTNSENMLQFFALAAGKVIRTVKANGTSDVAVSHRGKQVSSHSMFTFTSLCFFTQKKMNCLNLHRSVFTPPKKVVMVAVVFSNLASDAHALITVCQRERERIGSRRRLPV
jgi:hypothetical protein